MTDPVFLFSRERRIDWARMIANLLTAGMSLQEIADLVQCGKTTLRGYTNEDMPSEPSYWLGHRLLALWCSRCGTQLNDAPTHHVQLSVSAMMRSFD